MVCYYSHTLVSLLEHIAWRGQTYTVPVTFKAILDVAGARPDCDVDAAVVAEVMATAYKYVKYMEVTVTCMF